MLEPTLMIILCQQLIVALKSQHCQFSNAWAYSLHYFLPTDSGVSKSQQRRVTNEPKNKYAYVNESQSNMAKAPQRRSTSGVVFSRAPVVTTSSATGVDLCSVRDCCWCRGQGSVLALSTARSCASRDITRKCRWVVWTSMVRARWSEESLPHYRPINARCLDLLGQELSQLIDLNTTLWKVESKK